MQCCREIKYGECPCGHSTIGTIHTPDCPLYKSQPFVWPDKYKEIFREAFAKAQLTKEQPK